MKSLKEHFIDTDVFFEHISERYQIDPEGDLYINFIEGLQEKDKRRFYCQLEKYMIDMPKDDDLFRLCFIYLIQYYFL